MRLGPAFVFVFVAVAFPARADLPRASHSVSIDARVDPSRHEVVGETTIRFTNTSRVALGELVFHRYLEAFRDEHSVFARESGGELRGVGVRGRGGLELRAFSIDGVDRLASLERELVPRDFTQFRIRLESPIPPGETRTIRIAFTARLPPLAARAGYVGDFHLVAQWFPKLAKLEDDGTFASFPYHGFGEFYADFADYDVRLDVPADATVEGSGERIEDRRIGDRRRVRFRAPYVHDVAYVVADDFVTEETHCGAVRIRTTFPYPFVLAAREHARVTCAGVRFLSRELGDYPYPVLTVIVPPEGADGGAGMEYPTAFVTAGPWYPTAYGPYSTALETTLHELSHQWFQGLVASNEVAYPVLDEGLASFVGYDLMRVVLHREDAARFDWWRTYVTRRDVAPGSPVTSFDGDSLGSSVYGRSAVVFETLARSFGRPRLYGALGTYARAQRFRHPRPADLIAAFDASYGNGFGRRVLEPTLLVGERIELVASVSPDGSLVGEVRGTAALPIEVELHDAHGVRRTSFRGVSRFVAPAGTNCLVLDPDEKLLLDPFRRDDTACIRREEGPLRSRLAALFGFLAGVFGP